MTDRRTPRPGQGLRPEADEDRAARQERAQRAAATREPTLEAPGDPETLAQRVATASRVDGARA